MQKGEERYGWTSFFTQGANTGRKKKGFDYFTFNLFLKPEWEGGRVGGERGGMEGGREGGREREKERERERADIRTKYV